MSKPRMVRRFSAVVRVSHWLYALSFITLAITGYMIYGSALDWMIPLFGSLEGAMVVHRVAAVFLITAVIIPILMRPREVTAWLGEVFTFTEADTAFLKTFPAKFVGVKKKIPPQGFYNGGEKINSLIQIISGLVMITTGLFMWLSSSPPPIMYPLHALFMAIGSASAIGHIYLALLNPVSNEAIRAMINGDVSEKYMQENHGQWYQEVYKAAPKEKRST
ncbi:formate dehydrogenase subunit gamma [Desulfurivibrio sp. D14AmB]|uniref:formate dehydrogenase subunit gamma n=1 Tax=Desulfurivibrio sp. D14AmB TaxID=3374370 RepID=UPI00376F0BD5